MSTKEQWVEDLTAYVDGELPELERRRIEEALKNDPALAAMERRVRETVEHIRQLPSVTASPDLRRAVLHRIGDPAPSGWRALLRWPWLLPASGAVAATAVAVAVSTFGPGPERPALDAETLFVAQNIELLEEMDVVGLEQPDDLEVVMNLEQLEAP